MSLQTHRDKLQAKPTSLERMVPRWILISSATFWICLSAAILLSAASLSVFGWILFALVAICSTFVVRYLGKSSVRTLQYELKLLAQHARRDNVDEAAKLEYAEFSEIAVEIDDNNSAHRDEMESLRLAAYRDVSTGLPNRLSFIAEMKQGLRTATEGQPCTVFHLITNGYHGANDLLGTTGNQQLQSEIASRLSLYLASSHTASDANGRATFLASIGPDQFGIFMPAGNGREQATALAHELRQLFQQPFTIDGRKINVKISGGLAVAPDDSHVAEILLKNAGLALNEILRTGKVGYRYFSPRLERLAIGRSKFEQELRDAVEQKVFYPVYQPKIDLSTGKIVGVEALARWQHADGKAISPGTFIPLAEELGLIDQIGLQILRQSCRAAAGLSLIHISEPTRPY